jgi:hypothetical protein
LQDGSHSGHLLCSKWYQLINEITIDAEHCRVTFNPVHIKYHFSNININTNFLFVSVFQETFPPNLCTNFLFLKHEKYVSPLLTTRFNYHNKKLLKELSGHFHCINVTSLNVRHFRIIKATRLKCSASKSP